MGDGNNCSTAAFVGFIGLLAVAAMCVALAALVKPGLLFEGRSGAYHQHRGGLGDDTRIFINSDGTSASLDLASPKTYTFAIGPDFSALEFRNEEGTVIGFDKDIVTAVCESAGLKCRTVVDVYPNCWKQGDLGGQGLLAGWYDACVGYLPTAARLDVFDISDQFLAAPNVYFFKKSGHGFDYRNLANKKIGFISGWVETPTCLTGLSGIANNNLPDNRIFFYPNAAAAADALQTGEIDAIFSDDVAMSVQLATGSIDSASSAMTCAIDGYGIMVQKSDADLIHRWNDGFRRLHDSGKYSSMCSDARVRYEDRGPLKCI